MDGTAATTQHVSTTSTLTLTLAAPSAVASTNQTSYVEPGDLIASNLHHHSLQQQTETANASKNKRKNFSPRCSAVSDPNGEGSPERLSPASKSPDAAIRSLLRASPPSLSNNHSRTGSPHIHPHHHQLLHLPMDAADSGLTSPALDAMQAYRDRLTALYPSASSRSGLSRPAAGLMANEARFLYKNLNAKLKAPFGVSGPPGNAGQQDGGVDPPHVKVDFDYNAFNVVQELLNVYGLSISPGDIVDAFKKQADGGCGGQPPTPPRTPVLTSTATTSTVVVSGTGSSAGTNGAASDGGDGGGVGGSGGSRTDRPELASFIGRISGLHDVKPVNGSLEQRMCLDYSLANENCRTTARNDATEEEAIEDSHKTTATTTKTMTTTCKEEMEEDVDEEHCMNDQRQDSDDEGNEGDDDEEEQSDKKKRRVDLGPIDSGSEDCLDRNSTAKGGDVTDDSFCDDRKDQFTKYMTQACSSLDAIRSASGATSGGGGCSKESNFSDPDDSQQACDLSRFNDDSNMSTDDRQSDDQGSDDVGTSSVASADLYTPRTSVNKNVESLLDKCSLGFFSPILQLAQLQNEEKNLHADNVKTLGKFSSYLECKNDKCRLENLREHYHCYDLPCMGKILSKKEEIIRHIKWHKKRNESLSHGFLRFSSSDDCSPTFGRNCTHNRKQTHYHCFQPNCDKVYISTSDVQMHSNYHRKDSAIFQEGFQRYRATEECNANYCIFSGQRTTHFHCRRDNCRYTFKNKADMEKHKSYHIKDLQLARDGFKKFLKTETCPFKKCKFSKICNHIHCVRDNCSYVLHSSGQLSSHKRKHERMDSEEAYRRFKMVQKATAAAGMLGQDLSLGRTLDLSSSKPSTPSSTSTAISPDLQIPLVAAAASSSITANPHTSPGLPNPLLPLDATTQSSMVDPYPMKFDNEVFSKLLQNPIDLRTLYNETSFPFELVQELQKKQEEILRKTQTHSTDYHCESFSNNESSHHVKQQQQQQTPRLCAGGGGGGGGGGEKGTNFEEVEQMIRQYFTDNCTRQAPPPPPPAAAAAATAHSDENQQQVEPLNLNLKNVENNWFTTTPGSSSCRDRENPIECFMGTNEVHVHCLVKGCEAVVPHTLKDITEHMRMHELNRNAESLMQSSNLLQITSIEGFFNRKRGRPPKNRVVEVYNNNAQQSPQAIFTSFKLEKSSVSDQQQQQQQRALTTTTTTAATTAATTTATGQNVSLTFPAEPCGQDQASPATADSILNYLAEKKFRIYQENEKCNEPYCSYSKQMHFHCIYHKRCHFATRIGRSIDKHMHEFHVTNPNLFENYEFYDRGIECSVSGCTDSRTNHHFHCLKCRQALGMQHDLSFHLHTCHSPDERDRDESAIGEERTVESNSKQRDQDDDDDTDNDNDNDNDNDYENDHDHDHENENENENVIKSEMVVETSPNGESSHRVRQQRRDSGSSCSNSESHVNNYCTNNSTNETSPKQQQQQQQQHEDQDQVYARRDAIEAAGQLHHHQIHQLRTFAAMTCGEVERKADQNDDEKVSVVRAAGTYFPQNSGNGDEITAVPANNVGQIRPTANLPEGLNLCQRPFCKLKRKFHKHCDLCNQAFSDESKLKVHRLKHSSTALGSHLESGGGGGGSGDAEALTRRSNQEVLPMSLTNPDVQPRDLSILMRQSPTASSTATGVNPSLPPPPPTVTVAAAAAAPSSSAASSSSSSLQQMLPQNFIDSLTMQNLHLAHLAFYQQNPFYYQNFYPFLNSQGLPVPSELLQSQFVDSAATSSLVKGMMKSETLPPGYPPFMGVPQTGGGGGGAGSAASSSSTGTVKLEMQTVSPDLCNSFKQKRKPSDDHYGGSGGMDVPSKKLMRTNNKQANFKIFKDEPIPHGYLKFRFNEDCNFPNCGYRNHQSHFHCCRNDCYYSFCDKTRFVQHTARHERLDKLMGDDFKQYRANMRCGYEECAYSKNLAQNNKSSHFHCLKCSFICSDTNKVVAHRRQHSKMEFIRMAGFRKVANNEKCTTNNEYETSNGECTYSLKQTHYHCLVCDCSVLSRAQLGSHRHRM